MERKLIFELFNRSDSRISKAGDAEKQLEFTWVRLGAVAAEGFAHAQIKPFEGLEDADAGSKVGQFAAADGQKGARGYDGLQKVDDAGNG